MQKALLPCIAHPQALKSLMGKRRELGREAALYLVFGALTTLVNWISFFALHGAAGAPALPANAAAWLLSVLFAYITNSRWVFCSPQLSLKEAGSFFAARAFTGVAETLAVWITIDLLKLNEAAMKIAASAAVVILNYLLSKAIIFKKRQR